jgi:hypothetical protein
MFLINAKTISLTTITVLSLLGAQPSIAASRQPHSTIRATQSTNVSKPICYVQIGGKLINLDTLCGVQPPIKEIDITSDRDRDGVPENLVSAMKTHQSQLAQAQSVAEYEAVTRRFESRLPYSDRVRQLQAQARSLKQKAEQSDTWDKTRELRALAEKVESQIASDSSYQAVQVAMGKVSQYLNRS